MDFTTALSRLLRDTSLRESFASNAASVAEILGVNMGAERTAFLQLVPKELEAQARVLVRKRYRDVAGRLPATCAAHEAQGWLLFLDYARGGWPANGADDALTFCEWLRARAQFVSRQEMNRMRFATRRRRIAVHFVAAPSASGHRWSLPRAQLLIRRRDGLVSEFGLRLGW